MKEQMKKSIIALLEKRSDYSFSELVSELDNHGLQATGNRALYIKSNLIIWENTSSDFNNAILELQQENKIEIAPLRKSEAFVVYAYGGTLLELPIANRLIDYQTPHWVPAIIKRKKKAV